MIQIQIILLRMQFSSLCFDEDENGHKSVIDGVERLTTIHEFVQNKSWMDNQVGDGKKVLVGRIGGHPY